MMASNELLKYSNANSISCISEVRYILLSARSLRKACSFKVFKFLFITIPELDLSSLILLMQARCKNSRGSNFVSPIEQNQINQC